MKHPKQVGMSCKNTRFVKRGLTWDEMFKVEKSSQADKQRWENLLARNKYVKPEEKPLTRTRKSSKTSL